MIVCNTSSRGFVANYGKPEVRQASTTLRVYEDIILVQKIDTGDTKSMRNRELTPLRSP